MVEVKKMNIKGSYKVTYISEDGSVGIIEQTNEIRNAEWVSELRKLVATGNCSLDQISPTSISVSVTPAIDINSLVYNLYPSTLKCESLPLQGCKGCVAAIFLMSLVKSI